VKMSKWLSMKMQSQLTWMTSILIVSILIFITVSIYQQASKTIEASAKEYVSEALNQLIKRHDMILNNYLIVTNSIVIDPTVQTMLASSRKKDDLESLLDRQFLIDMLSDTAAENNDILALRVEDAGNRDFTYGSVNLDCAKNMDLSGYKDEARKKNGKFLWIKVISDCNYPMLLGMRDIIHMNQVDQSLGTLYILLDWNRHRDLFENTVFLQDGANLIVTNTEGEALVFSGSLSDNPIPWLQQFRLDQYEWQDAGNFELKLEDGIGFITYHTSEASDWKFISFIPKTNLLEGIQQIKTFSVKIGLIGLGIAFMFSVLFARKISHPVKQLVKAMTVVENENFSVNLHKSKYFSILEMEILKDKFSNMGRRIRGLINENYIGKINEQEAKLQALQSQINPHFLYNTLDSLYWMLIRKDEQQVSGLILILSNCLRYAISNPLKTIPLTEELQYIEQYVKIQNSRFGNKIKVEMNIQESIKSYPIFKLMLQPIVENAIIHGLGPLDQEGVIEINGREIEGNVIIEIKDNGIGMTKEQEVMLLSDQILDNQYEPTSMGLRNVEHRIKLTYGDPYGLRIRSELYFGTAVTIVLPKGKLIK
jgi:two-component system sensor histidine kinase YesM